MFLRFLSDYPPFKAGQCIEQHDKFVAPLVPAIATPITAAEYRQYVEINAAIDREIERRVKEMPSQNEPKMAQNETPTRTGRRVVTDEQWRREIGQDRPNYWALSDRHFRQ